jgi:hypothetical protein
MKFDRINIFIFIYYSLLSLKKDIFSLGLIIKEMIIISKKSIYFSEKNENKKFLLVELKTICDKMLEEVFFSYFFFLKYYFFLTNIFYCTIIV